MTASQAKSAASLAQAQAQIEQHKLRMREAETAGLMLHWRGLPEGKTTHRPGRIE
jgi:hypothetical protein